MKGARTPLAGADPDDFVDGAHEDLPVADLIGPRHLADGLEDSLDLVVIDDDLEGELRHQIDGVLGSSVELAVPALASMSERFAHRHPPHAGRPKTVLHLV